MAATSFAIYSPRLLLGDRRCQSQKADTDGFQKLNVAKSYVPLVMQNAHLYAMSVMREKGFQNMEFMDDKSRKPYEAELKPLFQWLKSLRRQNMKPSEAPPDSRCQLDNSSGIFSY